jgi:hypothetical protein
VNTQTSPTYPCAYNPATDTTVPGRIDNVICVAATDQHDGLASFSNWGSTRVDLGAPGVDVLSTFSTFGVVEDDFEADDFATRWTTQGFTRTAEAPLTSFGLASSAAGHGQPANTTRTTRSVALAAPAAPAGTCTLSFLLSFTPAAGESFTYGISIGNTLYTPTSGPITGAVGAQTLISAAAPPIAAGDAVQVMLRTTTGSSAATSGAHVDDVRLDCPAPLGAATGTAFLNGTSMATPMVTGAAALLFSAVPSATVTDVRNALLQNTDPTAALAGKTATGGRLDVSEALDAFLPPDTAITSGTADGATTSTATFAFARSDAPSAPPAFQCSIDAGAWGSCASPRSVSAATGTHTFAVRAVDAHAHADPTPATRSWHVDTPAPADAPATAPTTTDTASPPSDTPASSSSDAAPGATSAAPTATLAPAPGTSAPGAPTTVSKTPEAKVKAVRCVVPRLTGTTLGAATAALRRAHCAVGRVTRPRHGRRLRVRSSSPRAGTRAAAGRRVTLVLSPKR